MNKRMRKEFLKELSDLEDRIEFSSGSFGRLEFEGERCSIEFYRVPQIEIPFGSMDPSESFYFPVRFLVNEKEMTDELFILYQNCSRTVHSMLVTIDSLQQIEMYNREEDVSKVLDVRQTSVKGRCLEHGSEHRTLVPVGPFG